MREKATYEVGKGKPPKNRRFGQPEGNPNGKTSEQKRLELANAEAAMRIRARALHAVEAKLNECSTEEAIEMLVEAAMLKLLKDSEDRGLGAPKSALDLSSTDGSMTPKGIPDDLAAALDAIAGKVTRRDSEG
jgi:hypothetical protein